MIDAVTLIFADGTTATDWPLTRELANVTREPVALTAVYGLTADKLTMATVRLATAGPLPPQFLSKVNELHTVRESWERCHPSWVDAVEWLVGEVAATVGED